MAKEILVRLTVDSRGAVTGVRSAEGAMVRLDRTAGGAAAKVGLLGRGLAALKANAVLAGLAAIYGAFRLIGQSYRDAGVQEIAEGKLAQALRNVGEPATQAADGLKRLAAETQQVSNYGDEAIITAQAMLLSFGEVGGSRGAGLLTQSLVDMAAGLEKAGGGAQDLNQIAAALGKALTGGVGALKRYGISLTETQEAAFTAAEGLDKVALLAEVVESNFGGLAAATIDPARQMKNAFGDLSEQAGGPLRAALVEVQLRLATLAQDPGVVATVRRIGAAFGFLVTTTLRATSAISDGVRSAVIGARRDVNALYTTLAGGLAQVSRFLAQVSAATAALGPIGQGLTRIATDAAGAAKRSADAISAYAKTHAEATAGIVRSQESARAASARLEAAIPAAVALAEVTRELSQESAGAAVASGDLGDALEKVESGAKRAKTAVDQIRESITALRTKLGELTAAGVDDLVGLRVTEENLERDLGRLEALVTRGASRLRDAAAQATLSAAGLNTAGGAVAGRGLPGASDLSAALLGDGLPDRIAADLDAVNARVAAGLKKVRETLAAEREATDAEAEAFGRAIEQGISRGIVDLSAALGEFAVGAASFGDVGRTIVSSLADLAQQVGGMMIAFGTAALALRGLLLAPPLAIAAGAGLVALGAAAKAAIGGAVSQATGGTSPGASRYGGGPAGSAPRSAVASGIAVGGPGGRSSAPAVNVTAQAGEMSASFEFYLDGEKMTDRVEVVQRRRSRNQGPGRNGLSTRDR